MPEDAYQAWQKDCLREMVRVCRGSVFYNHKIRYALSTRGVVYHPWGIVKDFPVFSELIWNRCGGTPSGTGRYVSEYEHIYQIGKPAYWDGCQGFTNIWKFPAVKNSDHPCAFPIELPIRAIVTACPPDGIVFDPFGGSGTVAAAAERTGRKWVTTEKSPKYIPLAQARVDAEQAQGKLF